ncbi:MAG TPA: hypothetical protein VNY27_12095 [Solirubrobacteraceae bacterium]|nr:hypothetical protein [Solirubrobacteraceae bacterium]
MRDEAGESSEIVPFKTTPIAKPELRTEFGSTFRGTGEFTTNAAGFTARIETNGAEATYAFAYSTSQSGPWTPCGAGGAITVAEDFAEPTGACTGLKPETSYFARVAASNEKGAVEELKAFETPSVKATVNPLQSSDVYNVTAVSVRPRGAVSPHGSKTSWRFESAPSASGPWSPIPGASGTISRARAEELGVSHSEPIDAALTGLRPSTTYYMRLFAENDAGEALCSQGGSPISEGKCVTSFETSGPPSAATFATHGVHGEAARVMGAVDPRSTPTSAEQQVRIEGAPTGGTFTLSYEGRTTPPIPINAPGEAGPEGQETVSGALEKLPGGAPGLVFVDGPPGGPYDVMFAGGGAQPLLQGDGSGLTPSGSVNVTTIQAGGEAYDAHYHFEYEPVEPGVEPFSRALSTPSNDGGSGAQPQIRGVDLPGVSPGASYRYRLAASSTAPGNPVVHGQEQTLTAPVPSTASSEPCPNEALRTGPSANLPDCRAYEQVTPVEKGDAQEPFNYGVSLEAEAPVGVDGEHVLVNSPAAWGAGPHAGHGPYLFSRTAGGWQMTAAAPEPEFGVNRLEPRGLTPDLTSMLLKSFAETVPGERGEQVEYRFGPTGGPYTTVATVPAKQAGLGFVSATPDYSKVILAVEDRNLVEPHSTTKSGEDLYEYSGGELRQVNVGVGTCGATSKGVSPDGSRVSFEAVPGGNCSAPRHLYVRVDGTETQDLGVASATDTVRGSNEAGTERLLERTTGEEHELLLEEPETGHTTHLLTLHGQFELAPSRNLGAFYLTTGQALTTEAPEGSVAPESPTPNGSPSVSVYRYDIPLRSLRFLFVASNNAKSPLPVPADPEGRYAYFQARTVAGLPGGAEEIIKKHIPQPIETPAMQVYRYDSETDAVECVSCASPSDPEPRFGSYALITQIKPNVGPGLTSASANGEFAFFSTPAALLPADVDGEIEPEPNDTPPDTHPSLGGETSLSSDVYEWRADGVYGCARVQGCLSLITNGRGGYLNLPLGSAHEGRDVFIYTRSQLASSDRDNAGDVYDVRIGGGFPPPPPGPVECEGDACSTPASAPNDATPSSFTFQGTGNLVAPLATAAPPPPQSHRCRKGTRLVRHRCVRVRARHAKARTRRTSSGYRRRGGSR